MFSTQIRYHRITTDSIPSLSLHFYTILQISKSLLSHLWISKVQVYLYQHQCTKQEISFVMIENAILYTPVAFEESE